MRTPLIRRNRGQCYGASAAAVADERLGDLDRDVLRVNRLTQRRTYRTVRLTLHVHVYVRTPLRK